MEILLFTVILIYLIIASWSDLKRLEVSDWLNYSLILLGLSYNLFVSISVSSLTPIIHSVAGFLFCYAISSVLYYTGQWGGGDAKFFSGIGALLGVSTKSSFPFINLLGYSHHGFSILPFIAITMISGGIFGLVYIAVKAILKRKEFLEEYKIQSKKVSKYKIIILVTSLILVFSSVLIKEPYLRFSFIVIAVFPYLSLLLYIFIKSAEKSAMTKDIEIPKLTEGDWIIKDITLDGKIICKKKKVGLEIKDLERLKALYSKGKIRKVTIKNGFPFIPSFLIGLVAYSILDSLLLIKPLLEFLPTIL